MCILRLFLIGIVLLITNHVYGNFDKTSCDSIAQYYAASDEIFANPERGFIHTYSTLKDGNKLNVEQLESLRNENVSTILRIVYLDAFKTSDLSSDKLESISDDFELIREHGLKVIVRFAYTDDIEGDDAPLAIVLRHIDQLSSLLRCNEDIIPFFQAGFIGAWGEWHSSSNNLTTLENQRSILFKLLEVLPESIMVQVRTPLIKQQVFEVDTPTIDNTITRKISASRVGHHNDCFLSNVTDYGTYSFDHIISQKSYINQEGLYVPVGGETCPPTDGFDPNCQYSEQQLEYLRWSYLNLDWFGPTLDYWRRSGCFDQIQRRLGYRFRLVSAQLPTQIHSGQNQTIGLQFFNEGYAPIYQKKKVKLIFQNKTNGISYHIPLNIDLRKCKPGQYINFLEDIRLESMAPGDYNVFISITDGSPKLQDNKAYNLRLANQGIWDQNRGWNNLHHIMRIDPFVK